MLVLMVSLGGQRKPENLVAGAIRNAIRANRFARIIRDWNPYFYSVQKNPRVRKIRVRNFGAGNGCANFMDTRKNAFFLQEKPCP